MTTQSKTYYSSPIKALCHDVEEMGTMGQLVMKSNLPLKVKTQLMNNYNGWLPEYRRELYSSLYEALTDNYGSNSFSIIGKLRQAIEECS